MSVKVVILFGAGASNGAGGMFRPPPLGNQLFEDLSTEFPDTWGKLPKELSHFFEQHFEDGMDELLRQVGTIDNLRNLLIDMTLFFGKFRIDNHFENLYWHLIGIYKDAIESNQIVLATINYDCLIEIAALQFNPTTTYWGENKGIKLLKIHGSSNFFKSGIQIAGGNFIMRDKILGPIFVVDPFLIEVEMKKVNFPSAMSLYTKKKDILVGPEQIIEIQAEFQKDIGVADLVIVVGIRPNPSDEHIWSHLRDTNAKIVLIGNESECKEWLQNNRDKKGGIWLSDRFSKAFSGICHEIDVILQN
jgi:hypothetical protein